MNIEGEKRAGHLDADTRAEVLGNVEKVLNGPDSYGLKGVTTPTMQEITNSKCVEHLQKELARQIESAQVRIGKCQDDIERLKAEIVQNQNYAKLLEEIQKRLK